MNNRREFHITTLQTMSTVNEDSVAIDTIRPGELSPLDGEYSTVQETDDENNTVQFDPSQSSAAQQFQKRTQDDPDSQETYRSNPPAGEQETPFRFTGRQYHTGKLKKITNHQIDAIGPYKILSQLGAGGMGDVFKAYDRSLGRHVALKVIRDEDSEAVARFMREAQVQARVIHENVCKIYEVGEIDGKPFIAMQYIEGETLKSASKKMSVTEKLQVIIKAAEAVHEAHKQGLIHRDIKPDNIMVERQDNHWKPYVVDFGIAREQVSDGMTMTGAVLGTPQYMSPEQAKGEVHSLDARSDVYSLGATLYWLLAGRHLYNGTGLAQVLFNIVNKEAEPLGRIVPNIPVDLETMVMKCLEKEPVRRYASAQALADDLRYFLAGDPISARPLTRGEMLLRKAKKHRAITITITIATLLVTVMSIMGIYSYWTASEQAALAQQLGQEIERIDSIMRQAHLMPRHDLAAEKSIIGQRVQLIEELMRRRGKAGLGPGHYAIGRAMLIQNRPTIALQHLQKSWQAGYQNPEAAYWLGRALGECYQQEMANLEQISNQNLREQRRKELEQQYRDPARHYLKLGRSEAASNYGEALIAFYEQRLDEALIKSAQAAQQMPWLYEAQKLIGDIYIAQAREAANKGDRAKAKEYLLKAGEIYRAIMNIGRSDETVFKNECNRLSIMMSITPERDSELQSYFNEALEACDQALIINPQDHETYRKKSHLYHQFTIYQLYQDKDPHIPLARAIELAQQALSYQPNDERSYLMLGDIYFRLGEYELRRGQDPRATFNNSIESCKKALQIKPDLAEAYHSLGTIYWRIGGYESGHNIDPINSLKQALENCERSIEKNNQSYTIYNTIGSISIQIGRYQVEHGQDPMEWFEKTINSYQRGLAINPNAHVMLYNLSSIYKTIGDYQAERGQDPMEWYQKGLIYGQHSLRIDPTYALNTVGNLYGSMGEYQLEQHQDAQSNLEKAIEHCRNSIKNYPTYPYTYTSLSTYTRLLWEYRYRQGEDDRKLLDEALASCKKALEVNATNSSTYNELAQLYLVMDKYNMLPKATSQEKLLQQAETAINKSIELNNSYISYGIMAQVAMAQARAAASQKRLAALSQAEEALEQSRALNPHNNRLSQLQTELAQLRNE